MTWTALGWPLLFIALLRVAWTERELNIARGINTCLRALTQQYENEVAARLGEVTGQLPDAISMPKEPSR